MTTKSQTIRPITRFQDGSFEDLNDLVVVEEPLEVKLVFGDADSREEFSLYVTMRTPGNDFELVIGFLLTEGIVESSNQIYKLFHCQTVKEEELGNVVKVELIAGFYPEIDKLKRNFYVTSSCGVCGKSSIDAVYCLKDEHLKVKTSSWVHHDFIMSVSEKVKSKQTIFNYTGGLHATAVFDKNENILVIREDIGRHNAMDKAIGALIEKGITNFGDLVFFISGRAGFELVQKAAMIGAGALISVGAPSSLSVDLAVKMNLTLIGFLRQNKYNIYHQYNS